MSARPDTWMPLYVGDYLGDTMHLTTVQHGAYLLLIMAYWRRGQPLPDDDAQLAAIVRLAPADWRKHRGVLAAFFQIGDGVWRHHRVDSELSNALANSDARSKAGARGAAKRWQKDSEPMALPLAYGSQNDAPSPSPSPSLERPKEESASGKPRGGLTAQQLDEFETWWQHYPKRVARKEAERAFLKARKTATLEQLVAGAKRYAASVTDPKYTAHPATWLNQGRWSDEGPATNGADIPEHRTPRSPPPAPPPEWLEPDEVH